MGLFSQLLSAGSLSVCSASLCGDIGSSSFRMVYLAVGISKLVHSERSNVAVGLLVEIAVANSPAIKLVLRVELFIFLPKIGHCGIACARCGRKLPLASYTLLSEQRVVQEICLLVALLHILGSV